MRFAPLGSKLTSGTLNKVKLNMNNHQGAMGAQTVHMASGRYMYIRNEARSIIKG